MEALASMDSENGGSLPSIAMREAVYPLRSEQGGYSDLVCAAEAFLAALIRQWEAQISLKKPRPRTMLARDVQLALGILY